MTPPRLVHVGSAVVDYVYAIDALPSPGAEKTASTYAQMVGGGFNMMVAAARSGMQVAYGGQHGIGPNGDFLRAALAAEKIEVLTSHFASADTGNCVVLVTQDAERTFVSWPGAEAYSDPELLARLPVGAADWVFTSGYTLSYAGSRKPLADWIGALPPHVPFVFDPAPVVAEIPPAILARVLARTTWLSCNTAEAAAIAGPGDPGTVSARLLADHCPGATGVVVRAGERGCFLATRDGVSEAVASFKVSAVDTNGAGDTHIGAFVSALARGASPVEAARYANAAAAISVTRNGGASAPTDFEIRCLLNQTAKPPAIRENQIRDAAQPGEPQGRNQPCACRN